MIKDVYTRFRLLSLFDSSYNHYYFANDRQYLRTYVFLYLNLIELDRLVTSKSKQAILEINAHLCSLFAIS